LDITEYSYTVVFEPAEEGGFVVTVPALPGLVTEGDSLEEAREMVSEAGHSPRHPDTGRPHAGGVPETSVVGGLECAATTESFQHGFQG
jgi:HicB-like antitoxin of HicAB toxin-antitoxin system